MVQDLQFEEKAPWEKGFQPIFVREVLPLLRAQEGARRKTLKTALILEAGASGLALIAAILAAVSGAHWSIYLLIAIAWGFFALGIFWLFNRLHKEAMNAALMPIVSRFLGFAHARAGDAAIDPAKLVDLGLLPAFNRARLEDQVTGRHRDTDFAMVEVRLDKTSGRTKTGGTSSRTAWRGLLLRIGVPMSFSGRILLQQDYGDLGNSLFQSLGGAKGMKRVKFDDAAFEEAFEVYADDEGEAKKLLTPALLESLLLLKKAQRRQGMTAAFDQGQFFLALASKRNLFEIGSLFKKPADVAEGLHDLLFEATVAQRIIEVLHGERPEQLL